MYFTMWICVSHLFGSNLSFTFKFFVVILLEHRVFYLTMWICSFISLVGYGCHPIQVKFTTIEQVDTTPYHIKSLKNEFDLDRNLVYLLQCLDLNYLRLKPRRKDTFQLGRCSSSFSYFHLYSTTTRRYAHIF